MGIDDIGLDDTIDRNDFTPEQCAEVFKRALKAVQGNDAELVKQLMDAGFGIIKLVATLA